ncbi:Flp pilus assembly protein, protease CpaA [Plantibacter flavus]|uniref:Flp pilus assembly protein protease CpaA n=1 Tax=Plantibacter flavus TaxID=150123 RepID=A0A3N2BLG3_9MICO|nr:prepilin peptidase [Plantibacter flavus]ROR76113.1 Flp pilus assembly protein protease CpaA [Plantibacter flavus]SMG48451.1 Flp pilus assembly protein, protease CpaA [Plantibacter flavus]
MLELLTAGQGFHIPAVTVLVIIFGMLLLAAYDVWRREVEDIAVVALLGLATIGLHVEGVTGLQWLNALLVAAIAFGLYLELGQQGILGGGDVKLSIVPAFVFGALHPMIGLWWIASTILIHQTFFAINARVNRTRTGIPHVPAMAVGALVTSLIFPATI